MKRQLFTFLFAASVSVLTITACSKKADSPSTGGGGITKEKLVGTYKITEVKEIVGSEVTDILAEENSCDKDNLFQLKADMTAVVIDAGEQCSPPSDDTGAWEYRNASTVVLNGTVFTIKSFVGTTLKMTTTDDDATLNVTYEKQ